MWRRFAVRVGCVLRIFSLGKNGCARRAADRFVEMKLAAAAAEAIAVAETAARRAFPRSD